MPHKDQEDSLIQTDGKIRNSNSEARNKPGSYFFVTMSIFIIRLFKSFRVNFYWKGFATLEYSSLTPKPAKPSFFRHSPPFLLSTAIVRIAPFLQTCHHKPQGVKPALRDLVPLFSNSAEMCGDFPS